MLQPVVRMFNLGTFVWIDSIIYNWGSNTLLIFAMLRNGNCHEINLGIDSARLEALLKRPKEAIKFINALALVLGCATGQVFDSVKYPDRPERIWFPHFTRPE